MQSFLFWVISYVKIEFASNILEIVSVSGIGVLCDEKTKPHNVFTTKLCSQDSEIRGQNAT